MKKEKICIVPFSRKEIPFITCVPEQYEISAVVSAGTEIEGCDIGILTNRNQLGIIDSVDLEKGIKECDLVVISDVEMMEETGLEDFIDKAIKLALNGKKRTICFTTLREEKQKEYKEISEKLDVLFTYLCEPFRPDENRHHEHVSLRTPVVFIGEMIPECDGYEIFLKLLQRLKKDGLKGVGISADKYNLLYGNYYMPLLEDCEYEKSVELIKSAIQDIEKQEVPDVIIVKMPKPMNVFSDHITYDYGIRAFIISQAIHADYFVYCGLSEFYTEDFLYNINEHFQYKFGYPVSAFHTSNQIVELAYEPLGEVSTIYVPIEKVQKEVKNLNKVLNKPVYNLLDQTDFEVFYKQMKSELLDIPYGRVE